MEESTQISKRTEDTYFPIYDCCLIEENYDAIYAALIKILIPSLNGKENTDACIDKTQMNYSLLRVNVPQ